VVLYPRTPDDSRPVESALTDLGAEAVLSAAGCPRLEWSPWGIILNRNTHEACQAEWVCFASNASCRSTSWTAIRQRAHPHSFFRDVRVTFSPSIIDPRAAEAVYFTSTHSRTK
jgi:hypothetical protein